VFEKTGRDQEIARSVVAIAMFFRNFSTDVQRFGFAAAIPDPQGTRYRGWALST